MEGFVRPTGPCPAKIMIVGEAPGEQEIAKGMPFVGYSGQELDRMLHEAGIMRSQCFVTNVCRTRPPGNDISLFMALKKKDITPKHVQCRDKLVLPPLRDGIELLKREIEMCQPNIIIAVGNVACWALTGNWGITSWRGSMLECDLPLALDYRPKVIPTYHPSAILRQWNWRPVAVHDLRRAAQAQHSRVWDGGQSPRDYEFLVRPNFTEVMGVLDAILDNLKAEQAGKTNSPGITRT